VAHIWRVAASARNFLCACWAWRRTLRHQRGVAGVVGLLTGGGRNWIMVARFSANGVAYLRAAPSQCGGIAKGGEASGHFMVNDV